MPIMAPKVAFLAAFGIFIGTCLFKILIPDRGIAYPERGITYSKRGVTALSEPLSLC